MLDTQINSEVAALPPSPDDYAALLAKLLPRQQLFVQEYLIGCTATQAAISAGYSAKTAQQQSARLISVPQVKAALAAGRADLAERAGITAADVIDELAKLAFANMGDYITIGQDGDPHVDLSSLPREQSAAIKEIAVVEYTEGRGEDARNVRRTRFKLHDKHAALVALGKHLGMFTDRQAVKLEGGVSHDWTVRVIAPSARDECALPALTAPHT